MSIFIRVSELKPFAIGGNEYAPPTVIKTEGGIYDFITALRKAIRGIKFGVIDGREHKR